MKRLLFLSILLCATSAFAAARPPMLLNYGEGILQTASTPGGYMGALGSYWNPAGWATMSRHEAVFTWDDRNEARKQIDNWGVLIGGQGVGASMHRTLVPAGDDFMRIDDYQLALAGGSRADNWGVSYGWSKGLGAGDVRQHYVTVGNISRPFNFVSIGCTGTLGLRNGRTQGQADLGLRPFRGSHRVTLLGDVAANDKDNATTMQWGAGLEIMPLDGIRIAGKISKLQPDEPAPWFTLGIGFTLDATSLHVAPHYDKDSERQFTSYAIRFGRVEPSMCVTKLIEKDKRILALGMRGRLTYKKAKWLESDRHSLFEMMQLIDEVKADPSIGGIAFNMSGFSSNIELAWELAEKLKDYRAAGNKVYMYVDRPGMVQTYLMTQADYVWMDPLGDIDMFGWVMGRTYHKGLFEKLGLGVEEWRYFDYKSAFESYARKDMSEKDREQRQALLNEFQAEWKRAISENMGISSDSIDLALDSLGLVTAHEAERFDFVDTLGRWDDAEMLIELVKGGKTKFIERHDLIDERQSDPNWGEYPTVAVVYALGECAMDTGIRARYTSKLLKKLAEDDGVEAVVLRVDSPGGDGMASDWVADGMRDVAKEKPMVVSQGRLAASGGYWISSPGDRVFTSPFSITGSIGVIAGWVWNDGLTDKTGLTFDKVQVGRHADLGSGIILPFLNAEVPDRNVTDDERLRLEKMIRGHYDDFVGRVAEDRELRREDVEKVAQGRVWAGQAAIDRKLADEIGGLESSIAYAKQSAGISKKTKIKVVEYPKQELINFERLFGQASMMSVLGSRLGLFARETEQPEVPYDLQVLQSYMEHPAKPLFMLPPEAEIQDR